MNYKQQTLSYFKKDLEQNNIHYDIETKNKSFIKMSLLSKTKGIKNNKWMLALCQRELIGVDPHDPDLTYEQKVKISIECKVNPMYFFREVIRVPASGADPIPFKLDQGNMIVLFLFCASVDLFYVIARQIGKTITMLSILEYLTYICYYKSSCSMITNTDKLRVENISRLKNMRDALPKWLISVSMKDSDNKEGMYYKALDNTILTFVGQADPNAADSKVRGLSVPFLCHDEFPYTRNNEIMFKAATATMSTAGEQAKEAGVPTANMIFTTAGDLSTASGKFAHKLVLEAMAWIDNLFDQIDLEQLKNTIKNNSANNMVYITKSYLQLGKTKEWLEERKRRGSLSDAEIDKDFKGIWSMGSKDSSVIDPELLKILDEYQKEPLYIQPYQDTFIHWFVSKKELDEKYTKRSIILGSDGSEAIGIDFTTFVMMDSETLEVIGSCKCNISNLLHLSEMIFELLLKFRKMLFIPERNSTGAAIVDNLLIFFQRANVNPYVRIFNTYIDTANNISKRDITDLPNPLGSDKKMFGFRTTSKSRDTLYNTVLLDSIKECKTKINDARIISELQGLTKRNGRVDHTIKGHDDLLIAWLLCLWFVKYGRNTYLYDIDSEKFMIGHVDPHAKYTKQQVEQQLALRNRRDSLKELIEISPSNSMKQIYMRELRLINMSINEDIKIPTKTTNDIEQTMRDDDISKRENIKSTLRRFYPDIVS